MGENTVDLLATCWTSAGDVAPLDRDERSPFGVEQRVAGVAETGWWGIGLAQDDLFEVESTIGFRALKDVLGQAGLRGVEVELLTDWWETGERRKRSDRVRRLLFEAAAVLEARPIKIGTAFSRPLADVSPLVRPLRELADHAADHGVRVALEPMPFSMVGSVPLAARLVEQVGRENCGILVDSWHVFRAGTSLAELRACLDIATLFGVEIDDAAQPVVGTLFEDTVNERLLPGEGSFDLIGLIQLLTELGYAGPWGVEIISRRHRKLPLRQALVSAHDAALTVIQAARRLVDEPS